VNATGNENNEKTHGEEIVWKAGENTHENVIFSCFGGMSNTGVTAALASLEAVRELGLQKVVIGCLGGLPTQVGPVYAKTKVARRVVTVDGCPFECSRKIVEQAGFEISKSLVLTRDIGMSKKPLNEDVGQGLGLDAYISEDEVARAKEAIIVALTE
jgi:uncharacterized metal-binding protein